MCFSRTKLVNPNLNINSKELVIFQGFKRNRIYFGTPVQTPRNFAFAITSNGKVLDIIKEKFIISIKTIPEATQFLKLYKLNKRGKSPKFFEAETYFVNQNVFEKFGFETSFFEIEDKEFGPFGAKCFGELSFRVSNPKKFLTFLLPKMGIISSVQTQKIIQSFVNERIARILEKQNPTARKLYFKDNSVLKAVFEKLGVWLLEIGIELLNIDLKGTKFPSKINSSLSSLKEKPIGVGSWNSMSFEEWQVNNPSENSATKKPKFVTITPTGNKNGPFFKESMAPYFFEDYQEELVAKKQKKSFWKGVDEIAREEKSKQIVDLNSED